MLTIVMLEFGGVRLNLVISVLTTIPTVLLLSRIVSTKRKKQVLGLALPGIEVYGGVGGHGVNFQEN